MREMREVIFKQNSMDVRLRIADQFEKWLLESFIDEGLLAACSYPVVHAILALNILRIFLDVFGPQQAVQEHVMWQVRMEAAEDGQFVVRRLFLTRRSSSLPCHESFHLARDTT